MHIEIVFIVLSQLVCVCITDNERSDIDSKNILSPNFEVFNLPEQHLIRYLNRFPQLKEDCERDTTCSLSSSLNFTDNACWGHEHNCTPAARFQTPFCPGKHTSWVQGKEAQLDAFYQQADFGYIQQQIEELSLLCEPTYLTDSSLECSKYLRFCRGRNLLFDFRDLVHRKELIRYDTDVLKKGQVAGHCRLNKDNLNAEMDHMGALQSWAPEMRHFTELQTPLANSIDQCDMFVDTPTFIMKIDSTYNMYHHFCDFFNLYASLFVNLSHPMAFGREARILIWESYPYDSPFRETFEAFTKYPIWTLNEIKGRRVCFRNVVLPLLPRMIFGLYYNTPIIPGCQNSGLFRAFSEFILHRLQIAFQPPYSVEKKVRVTLLSRRTKYRRILNELDLIEEIKLNKGYEVRTVSYESGLSFRTQLAITRNTDVLIGMHGAGLTHLLFLPNWATIFELYNCEDPNCYKDLARLRGINYMTWSQPHLVYPQDAGHHPQGGAHAKFTNYAFDLKEFVRQVEKAAKHVIQHPEYLKFQEQEVEVLKASKEEL